MAPAGHRRHDFRVQLSGCRLFMEFMHRGHLRQRQYLEAVTEDAIVRRSGAKDH